MVQTCGFAPPPSVHVELFVTKRSQRDRVRRTCRTLYSVVRGLTADDGGSGPHLFLLDPRPRTRTWPGNVRDAMGAGPDEDVWLELAFYPSAWQRRRTLRKLWAIPRVARLAAKAEELTLRRKRSWLLATGGARLDSGTIDRSGPSLKAKRSRS